MSTHSTDPNTGSRTSSRDPELITGIPPGTTLSSPASLISRNIDEGDGTATQLLQNVTHRRPSNQPPHFAPISAMPYHRHQLEETHPTDGTGQTRTDRALVELHRIQRELEGLRGVIPNVLVMVNHLTTEFTEIAQQSDRQVAPATSNPVESLATPPHGNQELQSPEGDDRDTQPEQEHLSVDEHAIELSHYIENHSAMLAHALEIVHSNPSRFNTRDVNESQEAYRDRVLTQARHKMDSDRRAAAGAQTFSVRNPSGFPIRDLNSKTRVPLRKNSDSVQGPQQESSPRPRPMSRPLFLNGQTPITGRQSTPMAPQVPPVQRPRQSGVTFQIPSPSVGDTPDTTRVRPFNANITTTVVNNNNQNDRVSQMIQYAYQEAANEATYSINTQKLGMKLNPPQYSGAATLSEFEKFITDLLRLRVL
jgi:hypothetical protein